MPGLLSRLTASAALLTLLGACGVLPEATQTEPTRYELTWQPAAEIPQDAATGTALFVSPPVAAEPYDTVRMIYVAEPLRIQYFADNQWAAEPAAMLQAVMLAELNSRRAFKVVSTGVPRGTKALRLEVNLLRIRQEFTSSPSAGVVELKAELSRVPGGEIVAAGRFSARRNATQESPRGGAVALNQAVQQLVAELADFVIANAGN
ncbi:MAG: hypothetical protein HKO62_12330 [Gammaproteobacteria bacterium]|nr:hypothetical protein [Gammaproteobacteria bacterium]